MYKENVYIINALHVHLLIINYYLITVYTQTVRALVFKKIF